jgi:hypothetical protein
MRRIKSLQACQASIRYRERNFGGGNSAWDNLLYLNNATTSRHSKKYRPQAALPVTLST